MSIEQPSIEKPNNVDSELREKVSEKLKKFLRKLTPLSDAYQQPENTAAQANEVMETSDVLENSEDKEPEKTEVLE